MSKNRKHSVILVAVPALIQAKQYVLAAGLVALYLVLNTALHLLGKDEAE